MHKLVIALVAGAFASLAAAQTATVNPRTIADHGTPAYHAQVTAQNVLAGMASAGLVGNESKIAAVKEATRVADHGTPVLHADEAYGNYQRSRGTRSPVGSDVAGQEIVGGLAKLSTR
jgi:hypothetical protein